MPASLFKNFAPWLAVLMVTACQENDGTKEKKTIASSETGGVAPAIQNDSVLLQKIIKEENADFYNRNIDGWVTHYAQEPGLLWICVEDDVTLRANGWDELQKFVSDWMKENPKADPAANVKGTNFANLTYEIGDKVAFVRFMKFTPSKNGGSKVTLESRTFKKVNNDWKIIGMVSAPGYSNAKSTNNIFVHEPAKKGK
jgi:hypothetical protein